MKKLNPINLFALLLMASSFTLHAGERVTILFAYTPTVRDTHGGTKQVRSEINRIYGTTRWVFNSTNTGVSFRRSFHRTDYDGYATLSNQLGKLIGNSREMTDIYERRDATASDLVFLFCEGPEDEWAYAWPNRFASVLNERYMNNFTNLYKYAAAHEIGHNLSSDHLRAYGWYNGNTYRSTVGRAVYTHTVINYFSSPIIHYFGTQIGSAGRDNRTEIINHAPAVADFR